MKPAKKIGDLFVISGPSGTGKTGVIKGVLQELNKARVSISYTTRPKRGTETEGVEYYFVDVPTFNKMIDQGEFLEWAEVHGKYYGTTKVGVLNLVNEGVDVFFDIDVQGCRTILEYDFGEQKPRIFSIFILPPDLDTLRHRLEDRPGGTNDIELRMQNAQAEIAQADTYDCKIVNYTGGMMTTIRMVLQFIKDMSMVARP